MGAEEILVRAIHGTLAKIPVERSEFILKLTNSGWADLL
jgi:hypothetical protein